MTELLGATELWNTKDVLGLIARLGVNLFFATLVIRGVYFRLYRNHEYVFTYYVFNIITFCLSALLSRIPIELGFALGLFAVFGILRYRTEPIRIRDLTYLFVVIGIGMLNAMIHRHVSVAEMLVVNAAIVGLTALLELGTSNRRQRTTPAIYDDLELLQPGREAQLLEDVTKRTGLDVVRVDVQSIDMMRDSAHVTITYRLKAG
jgi:hypothetical protein